MRRDTQASCSRIPALRESESWEEEKGWENQKTKSEDKGGLQGLGGHGKLSAGEGSRDELKGADSFRRSRGISTQIHLNGRKRKYWSGRPFASLSQQTLPGGGSYQLTFLRLRNPRGRRGYVSRRKKVPGGSQAGTTWVVCQTPGLESGDGGAAITATDGWGLIGDTFHPVDIGQQRAERRSAFRSCGQKAGGVVDPVTMRGTWDLTLGG